MSETFVHRMPPEFVIYTNYKVMFSSLYITLHRYFPFIERNTEGSIASLRDYLKIGFVRNPYARFVSLYVDKCLVDPKVKLERTDCVFLQPVQGQILEALADLRGQSIKIARVWKDLTTDPEELERCRINFRSLLTISFREFTQIAERIFERNDADPHFHPQHMRYFNEGRCILDYVFRLENINQNWERVCGLLNTEMQLAWENRTSSRSYRSYYKAPRTAAKVYSLYKRDFSLFSYGRHMK